MKIFNRTQLSVILWSMAIICDLVVHRPFQSTVAHWCEFGCAWLLMSWVWRAIGMTWRSAAGWWQRGNASYRRAMAVARDE